MKFLCPQCKAKYQIADEKIEGRTLRMKCRRCEHEIVVKGELAGVEPESAPRQAGGRATPSPRTAAGSRRAAGAALGGSQTGSASRAPGPRGAGSALGADFRRQMSAGAAEPARPPTVTPLDAWHVAIHEVPVGPMKRDELAHKIAVGAVTGESLCWREGFDDWRPLRDVAELSPLLRRPTAAPPGAARHSVPGARPAPPTGRPTPNPRVGGMGGRAAGPNASHRPGAGRGATAAGRSNVVPIGGRGGAAVAPVFDEAQEEFETQANMMVRSPLEADPGRASAPDAAALAALAAASSGSMAQAGAPSPAFDLPGVEQTYAPAYSQPVRRRKQMSPFVWIVMAGAGAFGMTLAMAVATRLLQQPPAPAVAAVAPAVAPAEGTTPHAPLVIPEENRAVPVEQPAAPEVVAANTPRTPAKRGTGATAPVATGGRQLSAAEQAAIDRMTGGGTADTNLTQGPHGLLPTAPTVQAPELSAEQLRTVVTRNRPGLQHCYEMAARQAGSGETMRANIDIAVGGSGVVTRVSVTAANAPVQLTNCLEAQVRRWHFPAGGEATFPIVFSPGG